jgi:hypothetical protein
VQLVRIFLVAVLGACVLAATAAADAGRLSRADYVARGNRICVEREAYLDGLPSLEGKKPAEVVAMFGEALTILGRELSRFRSARPPSAMDADAVALRTALERQLGTVRRLRDLVASRKKGAAAFTELDEALRQGDSSARAATAAAKRLGLTRCNWS